MNSRTRSKAGGCAHRRAGRATAGITPPRKASGDGSRQPPCTARNLQPDGRPWIPCWTVWPSTIIDDCTRLWVTSVRCNLSNAGMRHSAKRPHKSWAKSYMTQGRPLQNASPYASQRATCHVATKVCAHHRQPTPVALADNVLDRQFAPRSPTACGRVTSFTSARAVAGGTWPWSVVAGKIEHSVKSVKKQHQNGCYVGRIDSDHRGCRAGAKAVGPCDGVRGRGSRGDNTS